MDQAGGAHKPSPTEVNNKGVNSSSPPGATKPLSQVREMKGGGGANVINAGSGFNFLL